MDELPPHPTTNHPILALSGAGVSNSLKDTIMDSPDVVKEVKLRAKNSTLFSMPKTDFGRTYKMDIHQNNKSDVAGYLQEQTLEELRNTHIMKDYPVYSRAPGRTKEVEDFYMDLQLQRRKICDRKPLLTEPMKYATKKMPFEPANQEQWFKRLDDIYFNATSYLLKPRAKSVNDDINMFDLADYTKKQF